MALNLDLPRFLKRDWQKRPLLVRGALADFESPINGDDLAGLAADPRALARLVQSSRRAPRWTLKQGPFAAEDYARLGLRDWTLLVQDVDKWLPEVFAPLLAEFDFLPSWRIEDVMVSFAVVGGSVGAHVDQYDVFLLQASGHRRWLIDDRPNPPIELDPRAPLKLLRTFQPNCEWVLGPGDLLYLPPGVPHHGIAEDNCLTFSIGLRAPSATEMLQALASDLLERDASVARYRDPPLAEALLPGQIDLRAVKRVRRTLKRLLKSVNDADLAASFGRFMSSYRAPRQPLQRVRSPGVAGIGRALADGGGLHRHSWQRLNWTQEGTSALLHGAGTSARLPVEIAVRLCSGLPLQIEHWLSLDLVQQQALRQLLAAGALELVRG